MFTKSELHLNDIIIYILGLTIAKVVKVIYVSDVIFDGLYIYKTSRCDENLGFGWLQPSE